MSEAFKEFMLALQLDVSEFLVPEPSDSQKKIIEDATFIMKENIIDEVLMFGGSVGKNEEKFKKLVEKGETLLKDEKFKEDAKDLKKFWKELVKKLREYIPKCCVAKIPVKEMPWVDVMFRTHPRLMVEKKKVKINENTIAYYGETKCIIARTTLFGKMKDAEPLFAPYMGELKLEGYQPDDDQQKGQKAMNYPYVSAIIECLDSSETKSQIGKYHEGYQRHGDPVCDFLMKDEELMKSMGKLTSGMESKRLESEVVACCIAIPKKEDKRTLLICVDESKESDPERYVRCFEALLRLSAATCEIPSTKKDFEQEAEQMTQAAGPQAGSAGPGTGGLIAPKQAPAQAGGSVPGPGGQELKVWSPEELAEEAQKRGSGGTPPGMASWSEEELEKMAKERGDGIPEGMEVWTEEDLKELAKKRQGGALNIPEWKEEGDMRECSNCGYALRPGWRECPICGTPVGAKSAQKTGPKSSPKSAPKMAPKVAPKALTEEAPKSADKQAPKNSPGTPQDDKQEKQESNQKE